MNDVVYSALKKKDFIIKNYVIKVAIELELSLNDTLLLIYFMNQERPLLDIDKMKSEIYLDEEQIIESFQKLLDLNLVTVNIEKLPNGKREEVISLDNMIKVVTSDLTKKAKKSDVTNLFNQFEKEFGRTLSPMEYEIVNDWLDKGYSEDLILAALREAVYNGAKSFRYITKILIAWREKGFKSKDDVIKNIKKEDNVSDDTGMFEYDWLDDTNEN